jgi:hypothetical protein
LEDVVARFVGDFRSSDRAWAAELRLGDRLELHPYVPRRRSLALQRDSDALLLLIPDAGGRGKGVLSGKVFEYLAAERPILAAVPPHGAAAELIERAIAALEPEAERARQVVERRGPRVTARFLASRGFSQEAIEQALDRDVGTAGGAALG